MVAGGSEAAQTVTVTNTGAAVLDITGISITGTGVSDFSETNTCGATVAVANSCTIMVSFTAATAGSYTATLAIANNASTGGSATVALSGTATVPSVPQASLSVSTIPFPSMAAGSISTAQTVTLTNTGGATLNISGIALSGSGANLFKETSTCGATLVAAANCTLSTTFGP
jgi:hypothetical protein